MKDDLEIQIEAQPQGTVVRLKGNAGVGAGQKLEQTLTRLCAAKPSLVVLDLSELYMIASLVMGQLVALQRSLARTGGKMRLAAVPEVVMTGLKHTRLDSVFVCFPTIAEALLA